MQAATVTAEEQGSKTMNDPESPGFVVTEDMEAQEESMRKEREQKFDEQNEAVHKQEINSYSDESKNKRLTALFTLVEKTEFYSKFLKQRMVERQEEEARKLEERRKRAEKRAENKAAAQAAREAGHGREMRARDERKAADPQPAPKRGRKRAEDGDQKGANKRKRRKGGSSEDEAEAVPEAEAPAVAATAGPGEDEEDTFSRVINGQNVSDRQPALLSGGVLREYQLKGMEWMVGLWENGLNGILGDEMGLGKTIQCIALIAHLMGKGVAGPYLIVAPLSTISNWWNEFHRFAPGIKTVLYHGDPKKREELRRSYKLTNTAKAADCVVITTYEMVMNDRAKLQNLRWKYIIVDEGHRLKNLDCKLIRELKTYESVNRLLLTGTPLQNNLAELWSLLNFLLPDIFDDLASFQAWFDFEDLGDKFLEAEMKDQLLQKLHVILDPFLLRRLKTDVNYYIPPKREMLVYCALTPAQRDQMQAVLARDFARLSGMGGSNDTVSLAASPARSAESSDAPRAKRKKKAVSYKDLSDRAFFKQAERFEASDDETDDTASTYSATLLPQKQLRVTFNNIVMQLRKVSNHPYLIEYPLTDDGQFQIDEALVEACGKLKVLDRLLPALKAQGHRVLIFSQMTSVLDILQDYCYLRSYSWCRLDGQTKHEDRQQEIKAFNEDMDDKFVFLLSTRAGGLGINLTSADTVIIYDSDWNPQVDLQAMDRCHRIGQTKPVLVYRLITRGSVEERMLAKAQERRKLEKLVINKKHFKGGHEGVVLDLNDIKALLSEKDQEEIEAGNDTGLSDARLAQLLDRSEESFSKTEYAAMAHRMGEAADAIAAGMDSAPASA